MSSTVPTPVEGLTLFWAAVRPTCGQWAVIGGMFGLLVTSVVAIWFEVVLRKMVAICFGGYPEEWLDWPYFNRQLLHILVEISLPSLIAGYFVVCLFINALLPVSNANRSNRRLMVNVLVLVIAILFLFYPVCSILVFGPHSMPYPIDCSA